MEGVVCGQKIDFRENNNISKNKIKLNKGLHILLCTVSDELNLSIIYRGIDRRPYFRQLNCNFKIMVNLNETASKVLVTADLVATATMHTFLRQLLRIKTAAFYVIIVCWLRLFEKPRLLSPNLAINSMIKYAFGS